MDHFRFFHEKKQLPNSDKTYRICFEDFLYTRKPFWFVSMPIYLKINYWIIILWYRRSKGKNFSFIDERSWHWYSDPNDEVKN